jgi:hypothetical protein
MRTVVRLAGVVLVAFWLTRAEADFVFVPLEQLVKEAVLIVEGKVTKIEDAGFTRDQRKYEAAVVEVKAVLKGDPKTRQVRIAQPSAGGLAVSSDIRFPVGQEGFWLLTRSKNAKGKEAEVFWALHPFQFQPLTERNRLTKAVKEQDKANK